MRDFRQKIFWMKRGDIRLADALLAMPPSFSSHANGAEVVDADSVWDLWEAQYLDKEKADEEFGSVIPPFAKMVIEAEVSSVWADKLGGRTKLGWCIAVLEEEEGLRLIDIQIIQWCGAGMRKIGRVRYLVASDGQPGDFEVIDGDGGECDDVSKLLSNFALFVVSLMNCSNIKTIEQEARPSAQRLHKAKTKRDLVKYKVLTIERHTTKRYAPSGEAEERDTPLHICRGHFKKFTPDKPLFGRITGTFWWESQVRGKVEHGVIVKDYEMSSKYVN
jgi:hypothetical protein